MIRGSMNAVGLKPKAVVAKPKAVVAEVDRSGRRGARGTRSGSDVGVKSSIL